MLADRFSNFSVTDVRPRMCVIARPSYRYRNIIIHGELSWLLGRDLTSERAHASFCRVFVFVSARQLNSRDAFSLLSSVSNAAKSEATKSCNVSRFIQWKISTFRHDKTSLAVRYTRIGQSFGPFSLSPIPVTPYALLCLLFTRCYPFRAARISPTTDSTIHTLWAFSLSLCIDIM